jgi:hypothetical protein
MISLNPVGGDYICPHSQPGFIFYGNEYRGARVEPKPTPPLTPPMALALLPPQRGGEAISPSPVSHKKKKMSRCSLMVTDSKDVHSLRRAIPRHLLSPWWAHCMLPHPTLACRVFSACVLEEGACSPPPREQVLN